MGLARMPKFGEVWLADFDPTVGHEQAGGQPAVIVSADSFNHNASRLVIVVPVTRTERRNPFRVPIIPPNGNLRHRSFAQCEMVRSISRDRLEFRIGQIEHGTMNDIGYRLRVLLDLR